MLSFIPQGKKNFVGLVKYKVNFTGLPPPNSTAAHICGFKAPYTLSEGLHNTLHYEFINKESDGITFVSE